MAKSKSNFDYFFREGKAPNLAKKFNLNYEVAKIAEDGDGLPENIYHVWGDSIPELICDCPAAYHHANIGVCKHVHWTRRWLAIIEAQKQKSNYRLAPVYYSAKDDSFYELPSQHIEDTIEDLT